MLWHLVLIMLTNLMNVMSVASAVPAELDCGVTQENTRKKHLRVILCHHRNDGLPMNEV